MDNEISEENQSLKRQLTALRDLQRALMEITGYPLKEDYEERICHHFKKICEASETSLFILDLKTKIFQFCASANTSARKYDGGILEISDSKIQALNESNLEAVYSETISIYTENNVYDFRDKYIIGFPVSAFSKSYGIFLCEYDETFTLDDRYKVEQIRFFINQIGIFLAYLVEIRRVQEKLGSLELLYEIGSKLSSIRNEDKLLEAILNLIERHMQVDRCSLMIVDEERRNLRIKKAFGIHDLDVSKVKVPIGEGIAGHVALGTRPLLIKDVSAEKHLISQVSQKDNFRTKSLLSVPLVSQGENIGVINVNNRKDGMPFTNEDMELLSKIGSEIASVLQRSYMALQLKKSKDLDRDIKRSMV